MREEIEAEVKKLVDITDPLGLVRVSTIMHMVDMYGSQRFIEGQGHALEQLSRSLKPSAVMVAETKKGGT